jgi:hypothetical protein
MYRLMFLTLAAVVVIVPSAPAQITITDDFNDGNDAGWTRYDPIGGLLGTPPSQFTFPAGGYRIQASQSALPGTIGQGRAGSFRQDAGATYTDFFVSTDVVNWSTTLNQGFGLGGRISSPGLQSTDGYLFLYYPAAATPGVEILRITDEQPAPALAQGAVTLTLGNQYRFEFSGVGALLTGQIFDVTNPTVPLVTVSANDTTWASGFSGLSSVAASATGSSDTTFDNYFSAVSPIPEPGSLALAGIAAAGWMVRRRRQGNSALVRRYAA